MDRAGIHLERPGRIGVEVLQDDSGVHDDGDPSKLPPTLLYYLSQIWDSPKPDEIPD